jgi:hypothetical protein
MKQEQLFPRREIRLRRGSGMVSRKSIKAYVRERVAGFADRQRQRVERRTTGKKQPKQMELFG